MKVARELSPQELQFRVWELRQAHATQEQIAQELVVSQSTVSNICKFIDDTDALQRRIQAEAPLPKPTGNVAVDKLEQQARTLELAQCKFRPESKEFLKRSEQIGWLLLKSGQLKEKLPQDTAKSEFTFKAAMDEPHVVTVKRVDPTGWDAAELDRWFHQLECSCGEKVWCRVEWKDDPAPSAPEQDDPDNWCPDDDAQDDQAGAIQ